MPNELPAPPKSGAAWRVTIQWVSCDQPYAENRTFISQTGCHERDGKSVAGELEFFAGTLASVMKAVIATGLCVPTCKSEVVEAFDEELGRELWLDEQEPGCPPTDS